MAKRTMKVYLPRWIRAVILPVLLLVWAFLTWQAFGTPQGRDELGVVGWTLITLVLALAGSMVWLMASGKLPAYIIEEDSDEQK